MRRYFSYLNTANKILQEYDGIQPFAQFLKNFFKADKKYGGSDRKQITQLCYCYFRIGQSLEHLPVEERIVAAFFLCCKAESGLLEYLKPEWNGFASAPLAEKFELLNLKQPPSKIFPWLDKVSDLIDQEEFAVSHLQQPELFIRIRPGFEKMVTDKIERSKLAFQKLSEHCLSFPNSTKIDEILIVNKEGVIQDYSSQGVKDFLPSREDLNASTSSPPPSIWDCCAGSGGKSILAYDFLCPLRLTVSDIRESILANLEKRFEEAGVNEYKRFKTDLTWEVKFNDSPFDLVMADVPCTGSGTWSRAPEHLFYFDSKQIDEFSSLQKKIVANIIPHIKVNGFLLYITCSVFKQENEMVVDYITRKFGLEAIKQDVIKGYRNKADTMFAALLKKNP